MLLWLSKLIDRLSTFFASRKGLLPFIGILFVLLNFLLRLVASGWLVKTDLFLHLGIIIALFGIMLAWIL
jgi:hypothetical protein